MIQEQEAIAEFAMESRENMELTFLAHQSYSLLCKKLAIRFHEELLKSVREIYVGEDWIFPESNSERLIRFMIGNRRWPESLRFGCFDFDDVDRLCFHVKIEGDFKEGLFSVVDATIKGKTTGAGWWCRFSGPYNRWETSLKGINALYSSKDMISYVMDNFESMSSAIETYLLKNNS